jgi:hypothetical protein
VAILRANGLPSARLTRPGMLLRMPACGQSQSDAAGDAER